jgi:hypothetical protein
LGFLLVAFRFPGNGKAVVQQPRDDQLVDIAALKPRGVRMEKNGHAITVHVHLEYLVGGGAVALAIEHLVHL